MLGHLIKKRERMGTLSVSGLIDLDSEDDETQLEVYRVWLK